MFDNLKTSDWIAAGLRGLSTGLTIGLGQGFGGGETPKAPTPGTVTPTQPIGDMDFLPDGAMPILGQSGIDSPDFGATVAENLAAGPNLTAQINTPMNVSRMQFDPTAPLFDITPEVDLNAIIPDPINVGGVVGQVTEITEEVIPENAYQVGDTIP